MRAYLAISVSDRGNVIPGQVRDAARAAIGDAVPVPPDRWRTAEWFSPDGGVALLGWSNEPDEPPFPPPLRSAGGRVLGYCGYLAGEDDARVLLEAEDPGEASDGLGGCFSGFRADPSGFVALTSVTRACPVYYAEAGGMRFAASRALLAHLPARAAVTGLVRPEPAYDVPALHVIVRHGFFTSDHTPFQGVAAVPNAGTLTAPVGGLLKVAERPLPEQGEMPRGRRDAARLIAPLAEAMTEAVRPFTRHDRPMRLALSGGRDSRLIAAACHAAGVPFFGAVHGLADDPDVRIAERVAAVLGVECQVTLDRREQGAVVVPHPLRRAHGIVRTCEGMNSAYESVNGWAPFDPEPRSSGSGGERLRGGFLTDQKDLTPDGVRRRLQTIFLAQRALLGPESNALAHKSYEHWCARYEDEGIGVLDRLHMYYKTGRWLAGSHTATLMNWAYYHPFLDNRVVRAALALPVEWRLSEEPVAMLIRMFAPALHDVPLEGRRWRYERRRPAGVLELPGWWRRATPRAHRTPGFNWRRSYGRDLADLMRREIMSAPAELLELVDRSALETRLAEVPPRRPHQAWALLTLKTLLSNAWREPAPDLPEITVPVT
ncbi:hypothetical protein Acsp03_42100 [Actinomadura sp. NBRC 104412]|uniref:asparagine synthase-related protein n=1 Tax=Actinomadura sp. NBRC 104412 TaxID=3032203 RepID=UPI0024A19A91|nr:asparagine synthase-related protein [Actinomadura sp. NBRC 104412]GLZ06744.1 hypothetical protein Acsp03_42100 [Actinomadura sp. NBRC 104412]